MADDEPAGGTQRPVDGPDDGDGCGRDDFAGMDIYPFGIGDDGVGGHAASGNGDEIRENRMPRFEGAHGGTIVQASREVKWIWWDERNRTDWIFDKMRYQGSLGKMLLIDASTSSDSPAAIRSMATTTFSRSSWACFLKVSFEKLL